MEPSMHVQNVDITDQRIRWWLLHHLDQWIMIYCSYTCLKEKFFAIAIAFYLLFIFFVKFVLLKVFFFIVTSNLLHACFNDRLTKCQSEGKCSLQNTDVRALKNLVFFDFAKFFLWAKRASRIAGGLTYLGNQDSYKVSKNSHETWVSFNQNDWIFGKTVQK